MFGQMEVASRRLGVQIPKTGSYFFSKFRGRLIAWTEQR